MVSRPAAPKHSSTSRLPWKPAALHLPAPRQIDLGYNSCAPQEATNEKSANQKGFDAARSSQNWRPETPAGKRTLTLVLWRLLRGYRLMGRANERLGLLSCRVRCLARISHSVIGERLSFGRDDGLGWARSAERRLGEHAGARPPSLRIDGAASRYVDCALSGSSGRGRREPGVGDFVFALVGEG